MLVRDRGAPYSYVRYPHVWQGGQVLRRAETAKVFAGAGVRNADQVKTVIEVLDSAGRR